jgi:predicted RNase H-like HicB family nuclease
VPEQSHLEGIKFTSLVEPAEEGGYLIKCVELPIATEGETSQEALENIKRQS